MICSLSQQGKFNNYFVMVKIGVQQLHQIPVLHFIGNIESPLKIGLI